MGMRLGRVQAAGLARSMRFSLPLLALACAACFLMTAQETDARDPDRLGKRWFKKKQVRTGSGLFGEALERRKQARRTTSKAPSKRSETLEAAPRAERRESSKPESRRPSQQAHRVKSEAASSAPAEKALASTETERPKKVMKRRPGRAGRGTGPTRQRRTALKPLFGE